MVSVPVQCPYCHSTEIIKAGKQANGAHRYRCHNDRCARRIFLLQYQDRGRVPEIRRQVVDLALNGSGIRDTALRKQNSEFDCDRRSVGLLSPFIPDNAVLTPQARFTRKSSRWESTRGGAVADWHLHTLWRKR